MNWLRHFQSRFLGLFRKRRIEAEMAEEIRGHIEHEAERYMREGMTPEEARLAARRQFGGPEQVKELCRDQRRLMGVERLTRDLMFAFRSLARTPGFTVVAVVTLALGIGANTSMFSVINEVSLRQLPYPEREHLDQIYRSSPQGHSGGVAVADYLDFVADSGGYDSVAAYAYGDVSLAEPGHPAEYMQSLRVSVNFFSTLGMQPQMGRDFRPEEATSGNHRVVIISHQCWQNRFGAAADVVGRLIRIDGERCEIVGVLPETFNDWRHLGWVRIFRPLALSEAEMVDRHNPVLQLIARRSATLSEIEADGLIRSFGDRLASDFPVANAGSTWRRVRLHNVAAGEDSGVVLSRAVTRV